ncbi:MULTISPECIES: aromatic ring-hydroxylating dioxygenase subunit alpha [unclassified Fusibacter]|uniref:aromatic ring-hydroxylating oxygenase subunit alpha n=1 Tax=unclassified Fusibacter TaxID=2624464 RepID=UPI0010125B87|nr:MULTISPECIES: aromatic ring-hydroxylating dioxygenase subunit alpha [unclassified Fusibacter]MCK8060297.1 aromatic ring-hydroxylating dioxygenase subunit alpha [Fusibacter sp. A2]NPE20414.1 aromatic ring-hydroxylating dioxygenase subunit alpha [Fusibacter sp. A1]RXV63619.1 aromatic ring-hydroxylating dioxygenase subunit alpha [Fusibacter sp. A1]
MFKNQWYAILESHEVKSKPIGVTRMGEKLVLWRNSRGDVSCIFDQCCHRGASLALGCVNEDKIACPFHGFEYDKSGKVTLIPANGKASSVAERYKVNAYPIREANGFIWLWYGAYAEDNLPDLPMFEEIKEGFVYKTFSEVWDVDFTRSIENQLDVVHVPFVHATTIGRGGRTIVNGPVVKWQEDLMTIYVSSSLDDGKTIALGADEIKNYESLFRLQFQVPNLWLNHIAEKVKVFAAFVPIDDTHTKIYLRFYQKFLPVPVLGKAMASLSNIYNKKILHQDRDVVLTQRPKKSSLRMDEKLIPGDLPIIEFRKRLEKG